LTFEHSGAQPDSVSQPSDTANLNYDIANKCMCFTALNRPSIHRTRRHRAVRVSCKPRISTEQRYDNDKEVKFGDTRIQLKESCPTHVHCCNQTYSINF